MTLPSLPSGYRWIDGGAVLRFLGNEVKGPGKDDVVFCWDFDTGLAVTDLYDQYGNHVDRLPVVDKSFRAGVPNTVTKPQFSVGVQGPRFAGNDWQAVAGAQSAASSAAASASSAAASANLVGAPADTAIAAAVNGSTSATSGALKAQFSQVQHRPINVAEAYGRTDTLIRNAITAALAGPRSLFMPGGSYAITGDISFNVPGLVIQGDGRLTDMTITDGKMLVDGRAGFLQRPGFRGFRLRRVGSTSGPALHLLGAGNGTGVARFVADDIHLSSVNGDALLVEGSYIGTFTGCFFESSVTGIRGKIETTQNIVGANSLTFLGCESFGNQTGWEFDRPSGVNFYGCTTEGNTVRGGRLLGVARGFGYRGGYFELNNGPDIEVDCNAGAGAIIVDGAVFYTTGATKTESILLRRGRVAINNNFFHGLVEADGDVAIRVNEGTSPVSGEARNNARDDDGTIVAYTTGGAAFNVTQLGQVVKASSTAVSSTLTAEAGVSWVRKVSQAISGLAAIAAGAELTFTISVPGAVVTDDCAVSSSILEAGLVLKSYGVSAADTVSVCLRNSSGASITPSARTYRVRVWR